MCSLQPESAAAEEPRACPENIGAGVNIQHTGVLPELQPAQMMGELAEVVDAAGPGEDEGKRRRQ